MAKNTIFKRKVYNRMLEWKSQADGSTALLLEGARRIGKSTITREFAKNEYESHIIIDFANPDPRVLDLFDRTYDLNRFFLELQVFTGVSLKHRKSVIIFDEVQFCPKARQAIKYLVADGRYDYIETGSLVSIHKNIANILIPSEEERISMFPLDFEEFMWAIDKKAVFDLIRMNYDSLHAMGVEFHRTAMRDFRLYMLVGGMPQAINAYLDSNDFAVVDRVKRNILDLYIDDFRKIDPTGRASSIFEAIPSELSRNTSGFKVGSVVEDARPSRMGELFADIADSKTVNMSYQSNDPGIGLGLHTDFDRFKMFMADTGLFVTLAFRDKGYIDNVIYKKLLADKLPTDLGYVFENVVAQQLSAAGHRLYYYVFKERVKCSDIDGRERETVKQYEIDFLISHRDKICPIEVKSSGYKSHKSIDVFQSKYSSRIGRRILLYTKDLCKDQDIICLPIYMAGLL